MLASLIESALKLHRPLKNIDDVTNGKMTTDGQQEPQGLSDANDALPIFSFEDVGGTPLLHRLTPG